MIQVKLFLCADSAAIDMRTNALSAFQIIDQLHAPSFPVAIPRISMIASLTREATDPSDVTLQLQIHCGNQQLYAGPVQINFLQQLSARTIVDMHGLLVPAPGSLQFLLSRDAEALSSWTILVNHIGRPEAQMSFPLAQAPPVT